MFTPILITLMLSGMTLQVLYLRSLRIPKQKGYRWWEWLWIISPEVLILPAYLIEGAYPEWRVPCRLTTLFAIGGNTLLVIAVFLYEVSLDSD